MDVDALIVGDEEGDATQQQLEALLDGKAQLHALVQAHVESCEAELAAERLAAATAAAAAAATAAAAAAADAAAPTSPPPPPRTATGSLPPLEAAAGSPAVAALSALVDRVLPELPKTSAPLPENEAVLEAQLALWTSQLLQLRRAADGLRETTSSAQQVRDEHAHAAQRHENAAQRLESVADALGLLVLGRGGGDGGNVPAAAAVAESPVRRAAASPLSARADMLARLGGVLLQMAAEEAAVADANAVAAEVEQLKADDDAAALAEANASAEAAGATRAASAAAASAAVVAAATAAEKAQEGPPLPSLAGLLSVLQPQGLAGLALSSPPAAPLSSGGCRQSSPRGRGGGGGFYSAAASLAAAAHSPRSPSARDPRASVGTSVTISPFSGAKALSAPPPPSARLRDGTRGGERPDVLHRGRFSATASSSPDRSQRTLRKALEVKAEAERGAVYRIVVPSESETEATRRRVLLASLLSERRRSAVED